MDLPQLHTLKNGEPLVLREAQVSDAAKTIAYFQMIAGETDFLSFGAGEFQKSLSEQEHILEEHRKALNRVYLLGEIDGELVGAVNVVANEKPRMRHIGEFGISVAKQHWGKGIGNILMQALVEFAYVSNILRKLNLKVQVDNHKAIALYKKFGFQEEGRISRDSFIRGQFYDNYMMGLWID